MKTCLKDQLRRILRPDCDWVLDEENNKIDVYSSRYWGCSTEEQYKKNEELIRDYKVDNDLVSIFSWCDISGFNYWMVQQEEDNYVSIDVVLKKESYTDEEVVKINELIIEADNYFLYKLDSYNNEE